VLLSTHSMYFGKECFRLAKLNQLYNDQVLEVESGSNKKRKLESIGEDSSTEVDANTHVTVKADDATAERDTEIGAKDRKKLTQIIVKLPDVDPAIFGLMLKFMYTGSFLTTTDARTTPSQAPRPIVPAVPARISSSQQRQTPGPGHAPTLPHPHPTIYTDTIPPSIHAWLLAQRLGAPAFMNHAISRIYTGLGSYFALSPLLIDHVWNATCLPTPTPSTFTSTSTSTAPPVTTNTHVISPSPLRKLFLDVLIMHWPSQHGNVVSKTNLAAWNALFDKYHDLRQDFIVGLQGGVKVKVQGFYHVLGGGAMWQAQAARKEGVEDLVKNDVGVKVETVG
jgi:hypothetical protein